MVQLTLSERVARLEQFLHNDLGLAGMENADTQDQYNQRRSENAEQGWSQDKVEQYFGQAQQSPKQAGQTAFEEIIQRIAGCNDRVCITADKLQKIGDRIMGVAEGAHAGEETDIRKSPDGTLDHTFMALNWLDESLSRLERVTNRMELV